MQDDGFCILEIEPREGGACPVEVPAHDVALARPQALVSANRRFQLGIAGVRVREHEAGSLTEPGELRGRPMQFGQQPAAGAPLLGAIIERGARQSFDEAPGLVGKPQPALNGHLSRQPGAPESTVQLSQVPLATLTLERTLVND